ncbi:MAG: tagaturonate epimerase family protein [Verrucomicrobia bacterium]|nr:tagaturonate epimerase family protein [Verrucomicrobiota bacterium]
MSAINQFLLENDLRISNNPCVSPDFCLDWRSLQQNLERNEGITRHAASNFQTTAGSWSLVEDAFGDHAWCLTTQSEKGLNTLADGVALGHSFYFPASFENMIRIKNLIQEFDSGNTTFPGAGGNLRSSTLGIGARFTTLHWPGVDWAMANLGIGLTANQNSIPRELVYDVNVMLADELETVPFPFIGTDVPEGHQGQSVEGMSHGCVLAKLKSGFHKRRIPWSFNADHQPIGGKFDSREDALVAGCLFASYITFDLSPELAITEVPEAPEARAAYVKTEIAPDLVEAVRSRVAEVGVTLDESGFNKLLCYVWPAMKKMKVRDEKYRQARENAFTTEIGRAYLRELSIDELPGLTTPETTAIMLALCEAMEMPCNFVAPAFGFQKNMPYPDNDELRAMIARQWSVCEKLGVSIGFHSGSGKSAGNYRVMGEVTSQNLEIKTSGRYTYEMGVALSQSQDTGDQALWKDWHAFTIDLAVEGAFSEEPTEQKLAREFVVDALTLKKRETEVFASADSCRAALETLTPSPDHMFWFEYNFLYVLAANGVPEKSSLGDHSPAGYRQRSRFYSISDEGRLRYAIKVAEYILFLAETTGLAEKEVCETAQTKLGSYQLFEDFIADI